MSLPTLRLRRGDAAVDVVPDRGALVTSVAVGGSELLYLDSASLEDTSKNVRGGIPVLFPFAGKLDGGRFEPAGTTMAQHGFGRNRPWTVQDRGDDRVRLRLVLDDASRSAFPYDYEAEHIVTALPAGAELRLCVKNTGSRPVPLSPGWHPYFRCPAARKGAVTGDVPGFASDRLGDEREFDFGLPAPTSGQADFAIPGLGRIRMSFSRSIRHLQFWSLPGRDFICLEPFFGPPNTIHTPARLDVPARESAELWMRIERL